MKDHKIRELVNQLRDIAIKYHGAGQLRERIAHVVRAAMLQENAKSAGESNNCRRSEKVQDLLAGNCRENGNSSTNNFREIAETSTGTAIAPAAPDKKLTDDVLDEIIAGAKTSMEQHLAMSLKAEREVWRKEGPTDDERIMAIEGMIGCLRCGDNGWVVGEMGITRCACGQAGNSPAHSGLRPEQSGGSPAQDVVYPAPNPIDHGYRPDCECSGCKATARICAELAGWIPVSERLPETNGKYWGWWSESKRQGPVWFIKSELQAQFQSHEITHWMPLPSAPQEVKGE